MSFNDLIVQTNCFCFDIRDVLLGETKSKRAIAESEAAGSQPAFEGIEAGAAGRCWLH
jgi:hypothetical protein